MMKKVIDYEQGGTRSRSDVPAVLRGVLVWLAVIVVAIAAILTLHYVYESVGRRAEHAVETQRQCVKRLNLVHERLQYFSKVNGRYPRSFAELCEATGLSLSDLCCPGSIERREYLYHGWGVPVDAGGDVVLVTGRCRHLGTGVVIVLFKNGRVWEYSECDLADVMKKSACATVPVDASPDGNGMPR